MRTALVALPLAATDALVRGTPIALVAIGGSLLLRLAIETYLGRSTRRAIERAP